MHQTTIMHKVCLVGYKHRILKDTAEEKQMKNATYEYISAGAAVRM